MRSRIASVLAATFLVLGAAHAAPLDRQTVKLDRPAIVGATVVPAGTYRVELVPGRDTARFLQGKKVVAEAPCRVGLAEVTYPGTAVHFRPETDGRERLTKIVVSSSKLAIEFPSEVAANGAVAAPSTSDR